MDGYGQFCPIALGAEVFAERWTPIILRNLMVGCERFGEILAGAPGLPRSVLSTRLRRLERDGVVQRTVRDGSPCYRLTECGAELTQVCLALGAWGARWREVRPEHLDPYLAAVDAVHAGGPGRAAAAAGGGPLRRAPAPATEPVLAGRRRRANARSACTTRASATTRWSPPTRPPWSAGSPAGMSLGHAQRAGSMTVMGPPWTVRMLDGWGRLSPFAAVSAAPRENTAQHP